MALVAIGVLLGVMSGMLATSADTSQADGTVIEFSEYSTVWTDMSVSDYPTALDLLDAACGMNGFELVMDGDDIQSIDGTGTKGEWSLWAVVRGSSEWVLLNSPYVQDPSGYTITSWVHSDDAREPTVSVDYSGHPIYGFSQKYRVVSLSPTVTEILCSVKASNTIVGADYYSDYPSSIVAGKNNGSISTVGTYTSPSFELIMGTNPDMVVCDGSQTSHVKMAERLRSAGIDAIVVYPGEDMDQVKDNIFAVGTALGYQMAALEAIDNIDYVIESIGDDLQDAVELDTMVTLEPDISPWISGSGTFMDSIIAISCANNMFSEWYGWVHLTSERISADTDAIIIITTEYRATQDEYDSLYNGLSENWKRTDAWKNGRVYVICEDAATMVQRGGPRIAQALEIIIMMLHPECFDIDVPKYVGNDYRDYLRYSKDMGYDG